MVLTAQDVLASLAGGEGPDVEFKRVLPRDERAARTLCAFANTRGGLLLVGITDLGRVHGVHEPGLVAERLLALAEIHLAPALPVEVQVLVLGGPRIVVCRVPPSPSRPHALLLPGGEREVLVRLGASNCPARGPTLAALRRPRRPTRARNPLEERILDWVGREAGRAERPTGSATVPRFSEAHNVGLARARRTFTSLESRGLLIGHGAGRARVYATT